MRDRRQEPQPAATLEAFQHIDRERAPEEIGPSGVRRPHIRRIARAWRRLLRRRRQSPDRITRLKSARASAGGNSRPLSKHASSCSAVASASVIARCHSGGPVVVEDAPDRVAPPANGAAGAVRKGNVVIYPRWQTGVADPCPGPYDIEPCMTSALNGIRGGIAFLQDNPSRVQPELERTSYFGF